MTETHDPWARVIPLRPNPYSHQNYYVEEEVNAARAAVERQHAAALATLRAQLETLTGIVRDTLWMAGRYADRRMSYAVGLYNDARVKAEALGCADGATIAIDGMDPEMPTWAERITDLRASLAAVEGERDRLKHENQWAGHHPWCAAWKLHRSGPGLVPMGAMRSEPCDCGWETARSGVGSPVDPDRIKRMQDEVIVLTADRDLWKGICRNRDGAHAGQITELRASLATRESALRALVAQWKQEAVIADATCTCQEKLAVVLEIAHRSGEPTDKPEGMRYITISDTLARELSERARAALTPDGSTEQ